jgi:hypothetical protein
LSPPGVCTANVSAVSSTPHLILAQCEESLAADALLLRRHLLFPLPYHQPFNRILYLLFGLEIALLAGGLLFGRLNEEATSRLPRPLRMLLSATLVLAAFVGWQAATGGATVQRYAVLIFLGMAAAFVGDLIMARLIPVPARLIFGMMAFGITHLLYAAAFLYLAQRLAFIDWSQLAILLLPVLTFCSWAWYTQVRNPAGSSALNIGSLAYGWVIGVMTALAVNLATDDAHFMALAAGALLFLTSDFILGSWQIRGRGWKSVNDAIWTTYVGAQLLIVYSVAAAWKVAH